MDVDVDLGIPRGVLESLPDDDGTAEEDLRRAVAGYRRALEEGFEAAADEAEAASVAVDFLEYAEGRAETYDEFVPELRAWGQSPIYAIAWRDLYIELAGQVYEVDWLAERIDRERNYRLVDDGIRFGKD
ncbi:hypothetical protein Hbl1158_13560 [Halobaculum sp. CBA1158]|uniref:hypothetical protein n=1 Tax=Halobaculum sp. CBA1158 TaxID=2904243 RepID=UPI001F4494EA|nr:hypothetical protein [Halobaculum sp. CBA1158]UIO99535.1 hypothetical protein Hbl1158_13560 [Halobaculum sp. CBA1158]